MEGNRGARSLSFYNYFKTAKSLKFNLVLTTASLILLRNENWYSLLGVIKMLDLIVFKHGAAN